MENGFAFFSKRNEAKSAGTDVALRVCNCARLTRGITEVSVLVKFSGKHPNYGSTCILKGRAELETRNQDGGEGTVGKEKGSGRAAALICVRNTRRRIR